MKLVQVIGVVDRIENGIAAIVPDDGSREIYVKAQDLPEPREGAAVSLFVIPASDPNGVCGVLGKKPKPKVKASALMNVSPLVRAMEKTLARLEARKEELQKLDEPEGLTEVTEKIEFLRRGIELFRG